MTSETHLFFDLGETLVDLRGLVPAMSGELRSRFPSLGSRSKEVASTWIRRTAESTAAAWDSTFRSGLDITAEALRIGLELAGVRVDAGTATSCVEQAWKSYLDRPKLYDDVTLELLSSLRAVVETMGLVTDSDNSMVRPLLARLNLNRFFDVVVVSESVQAYKPNPRIYRAALEASRAPAHASLFVSDSAVDLQGASAVGMGTVWIRRRRPNAGMSVPEGAAILDDFGELEALLASGE